MASPASVQLGGPVTGTAAAILDAARVEFARHAFRRANIDAVAQRAGVSRRTLYRHFPTKEALFEQLVEIDTQALFVELGDAARAQDARGAIVECFTLAIRRITESPLATAVIQSEPELLIGVNTPSGEKALIRASHLVAATLRLCGVTMPDEAVLTTAEILVRLVASLLTNRAGVLDINDPVAVRDYAQTYLARLVW
ncbi:TetR family transcriptional regulator [Mycolicibacter nonchromogenicus]|uniref:TetR family transcriptional regulator n=1 Tax=Mycolicibacter nonchromogenicus TaxID=1782 RepID=A0A1X1Z9C0_MYCNO|nr:helix-turn-helix domain-containing protein [Mycolicibacter nonchromogenicus]OBI07574.1 TetR family transcriptional regulator [Mycolicibacter heraklionensis]ORW19810.1 TetR family transcriptional regulator [Mycolicibacter nonchromogenicus]CRL74537.1 TetR family transcriptional regulator [Mycolicibacter nonchromogenicus]